MAGCGRGSGSGLCIWPGPVTRKAWVRQKARAKPGPAKSRGGAFLFFVFLRVCAGGLEKKQNQQKSAISLRPGRSPAAAVKPAPAQRKPFLQREGVHGKGRNSRAKLVAGQIQRHGTQGDADSDQDAQPWASLLDGPSDGALVRRRGRIHPNLAQSRTHIRSHSNTGINIGISSHSKSQLLRWML